MLKKTITYKDFDGNDVTEDFYFNLSMAEIGKMALVGPDEDFGQYINRIVSSRDGRKIMESFEDVLRVSVGQRVEEDGKIKFKQTPEITSDLFETNAYSTLFMELIYSENAAQAVAEFIKAIVPDELKESVEKAAAEELQLPEEDPIWVKEDRDPTKAEIQALTPEQMRKEFMRKAGAGSE